MRKIILGVFLFIHLNAVGQPDKACLLIEKQRTEQKIEEYHYDDNGILDYIILFDFDESPIKSIEFFYDKRKRLKEVLYFKYGTDDLSKVVKYTYNRRPSNTISSIQIDEYNSPFNSSKRVKINYSYDHNGTISKSLLSDYYILDDYEKQETFNSSRGWTALQTGFKSKEIESIYNIDKDERIEKVEIIEKHMTRDTVEKHEVEFEYYTQKNVDTWKDLEWMYEYSKSNETKKFENGLVIKIDYKNEYDEVGNRLSQQVSITKTFKDDQLNQRIINYTYKYK